MNNQREDIAIVWLKRDLRLHDNEAIYNVANVQTFHMFLRLPAAFYKALLLLLSAILFNCVENCVWILFELGKYMWYRISLSFRTKLFHRMSLYKEIFLCSLDLLRPCLSPLLKARKSDDSK